MTQTSIGAPARFGRFFLPGPTEVHPDVLEAQARPMIGHRGQGIQDLMERLQEGLRALFVTDRPVFVSTSSATGLMEAGVRNAARERVLSLTNGAFSERFAEIAVACGFDVDTYAVAWGQAHDPDRVKALLADGAYDTVTVVQSETSTGVLNDVAAIAEAVHWAGDAVLLVDSVTGVGGAEMRADAWRLDYVLTGSQKAMALPPGLAFAVASERVMERSRTARAKGVYFDLEAFADNLAKLQTPTTPAVSLMYALEVQLGRIVDEGVEARWSRHRAMAQACAAWVKAAGDRLGVEMSVLADAAHRSPTVTCVRVPEGVSGPAVVKAVKERGFVIGGGYGKLKQETVRIGHMGDHTVEETEAVLEATEDALRAVLGGGR